MRWVCFLDDPNVRDLSVTNGLLSSVTIQQISCSDAKIENEIRESNRIECLSCISSSLARVRRRSGHWHRRVPGKLSSLMKHHVASLSTSNTSNIRPFTPIKTQNINRKERFIFGISVASSLIKAHLPQRALFKLSTWRIFQAPPKFSHPIRSRFLLHKTKAETRIKNLNPCNTKKRKRKREKCPSPTTPIRANSAPTPPTPSKR
jgi:hypothetical protein